MYFAPFSKSAFDLRRWPPERYFRSTCWACIFERDAQRIFLKEETLGTQFGAEPIDVMPKALPGAFGQDVLWADGGLEGIDIGLCLRRNLDGAGGLSDQQTARRSGNRRKSSCA